MPIIGDADFNAELVMPIIGSRLVYFSLDHRRSLCMEKAGCLRIGVCVPEMNLEQNTTVRLDLLTNLSTGDCVANSRHPEGTVGTPEARNSSLGGLGLEICDVSHPKATPGNLVCWGTLGVPEPRR